MKQWKRLACKERVLLEQSPDRATAEKAKFLNDRWAAENGKTAGEVAEWLNAAVLKFAFVILS